MHYSQNDEQEKLLEYFGEKVGRFLDIGACDGALNSNTLALVERGWSGVLVEPSVAAFGELHRRHGGNRKLTLVHAAVGGISYSLIPFSDSYGVIGYSTTEDVNREKWNHLVAFEPPFYIPMVPLDDLLRRFPGPIDMLSIDTEGTSVELFMNFPFDSIRPMAVVVEHDGYTDICGVRARKFNYREVARNAENLVYVL